MTSPGPRRPHVRADPIGLGALAGLAIGWVAGAALGLSVAPQDIAWPATTMLIGTFAGLVVGLMLGRIVDVRRANAALPPAHDTLPGRPRRIAESPDGR